VDRRAALLAEALAYVALVERVPAGSEGSDVTRQLVRFVAGPLSLSDMLQLAPTTNHQSRQLRKVAACAIHTTMEILFIRLCKCKQCSKSKRRSQSADLIGSTLCDIYH
jgi:hypothetical protein